MLHPLHRVPIFAALGDPALELIESKARPIEHTAGQVILREGEVGNRMFVIRKGQVRVVKHLGTPKEFELAQLKEEDFFGEMCILETLPRAASVVALTDVTLLSWSSLSFLHLYETMPAQYSILVLNIARDLSRRIRRLDEAFAAKH